VVSEDLVIRLDSARVQCLLEARRLTRSTVRMLFSRRLVAPSQAERPLGSFSINNNTALRLSPDNKAHGPAQRGANASEHRNPLRPPLQRARAVDVWQPDNSVHGPAQRDEDVIVRNSLKLTQATAEKPPGRKREAAVSRRRLLSACCASVCLRPQSQHPWTGLVDSSKVAS